MVVGLELILSISPGYFFGGTKDMGKMWCLLKVCVCVVILAIWKISGKNQLENRRFCWNVLPDFGEMIPKIDEHTNSSCKENNTDMI